MSSSLLVIHYAAWISVWLSLMLPVVVLVTRYCWPQRLPWVLAVVLLVLAGPGLGYLALCLERAVLESLATTESPPRELPSTPDVAVVAARAMWLHGTLAWLRVLAVAYGFAAFVRWLIRTRLEAAGI